MKVTTLYWSSIACAQNLLLNGGFEDYAGLYCPLSWCGQEPGFPTTNATIAPWYLSTSDRGVDMISGLKYVAWGNWSIDLNSDSPGSISQAVTLTPQSLYVLKFKLNSSLCGPTTKSGYISVTGSVPHYFHHVRGNLTLEAAWKNVTYLFKATAANTTVSIVSSTSLSCGPFLDEFSLTKFSAAC